jgi:Mg-chelatase subunit ChlD
MKTCQHCGATNPDAANFCLDCGKALNPDPNPRQPLPPTVPPRPRIPVPNTVAVPATPPPDTIAVPPAVPNTVASPASQQQQQPQLQNFDPQQFQALYESVLKQQRKADILFVLDCTGSMQGEIDAVRDAITAFADTIASQAVRARVGLIEFRDRLIGEEQRALLFDGQPFTSDAALFRSQMAQLRAHGGGDEPESSLDALLLALEQPFDPSANKVIVLVTDAPPHIPDVTAKSIDQVVQRMREVEVQQVYVVMQTQDPRSQVYLRLLEGRRGLAFEIGKGDDFRTRAEDFKRTLMALGKTISTATR